MITGPDYDNFQEIYDEMIAHRCAFKSSEARLAEMITTFLSDPSKQDDIISQGKNYILLKKNTLDSYLTHLTPYLAQ